MNTDKHKTIQPLNNFKEKFEEWKNVLLGEDRHSIRNQIRGMIWDCVFFRCINESRRYAVKDDKNSIKQNRRLHQFINDSFFKTQLLSIRRLVDKDRNNIKQDKQPTVYSLYNLIEDLKKNRKLLTRENILAFLGLPYDYETVRKDFDSQTDWTTGAVVEPLEIGHSEAMHMHIDSVIRITADKRSKGDLVLNNNSFKDFDEWINNNKALYDYVNKYIAHSATPGSRENISGELQEALGKVLNAHKIICETASFIGNLLFGRFGEALPISNHQYYDLFEYLDEPIASKETVEKLRECWNQYGQETSQWIKPVYKQ